VKRPTRKEVRDSLRDVSEIENSRPALSCAMSSAAMACEKGHYLFSVCYQTFSKVYTRQVAGAVEVELFLSAQQAPLGLARQS
jgi:hypothetical protein